MTYQPVQPTMPAPAAPSVKKNMALTALILTVVASILIVLGFFLAAQAGVEALKNFDLDAAEAADNKRIIFLGLASLMNLVAFILALIALIKSKPKTMPLIVFIVVIVLPSVATGIGTAIQNSMLGM